MSDTTIAVLFEVNAPTFDCFIAGNLPFFSKVNLSKTYESLSQRGFNVSIAGVGTEDRPQTGP